MKKGDFVKVLRTTYGGELNEKLLKGVHQIWFLLDTEDLIFIQIIIDSCIRTLVKLKRCDYGQDDFRQATIEEMYFNSVNKALHGDIEKAKEKLDKPFIPEKQLDDLCSDKCLKERVVSLEERVRLLEDYIKNHGKCSCTK